MFFIAVLYYLKIAKEVFMPDHRDLKKQKAQVKSLAAICKRTDVIQPHLFVDYKVYRGLRDDKGRGVLTGLTEISDVKGSVVKGDKFTPCEGELYYRGYNVKDIVADIFSTNRFGFEEIAYLLLFGRFPNAQALADFNELLGKLRSLPNSFVRDVIMKQPSADIMNAMARSVLMLYSYDEKADVMTTENVLWQCLQLIAEFPQIAVYSYQTYAYYKSDKNSFFIHDPVPTMSTAENLLHMLRLDCNYTELEAHALDLALIVHAEHGGGNNSTFTTRLVSSTGTDTYSAVAAALGSLKGPKHGGANVKVCRMFDDIKENVKDWNNDDEIREYLIKILDKKAFDQSGLIYGLGHAVYQISDPRAEIFKETVEKLSIEKNRWDEFNLHKKVEEIGKALLAERRKSDKGICANVDFYSGFCYEMLNLPVELYTPIFAVARIVGWSAHRIEELISTGGKIMRPAYKYVGRHYKYVPFDKRR